MHGYTRQVKVENHYSASLSPTLDLALTSITGKTMPRSFDAYLQSRSRHKSMIFPYICLQNSQRFVFAAKKITTHLFQKFQNKSHLASYAKKRNLNCVEEK